MNTADAYIFGYPHPLPGHPPGRAGGLRRYEIVLVIFELNQPVTAKKTGKGR